MGDWSSGLAVFSFLVCCYLMDQHVDNLKNRLETLENLHHIEVIHDTE